MIFQTTVKWTSEKFLRELLENYPAQLRACLDAENFPKWCRLCAERLNQLDIAGYVRSRRAVDHFIKVAVVAYAKRQIEKSSLQTPTKPA